MISIRMLKLCNESICRSLNIIFKSYLWQGIKKNKNKTKQKNPSKNNKQCVKNYRPASLLPICRKVLERIIYNTVFMHFMQSNIISESQSGFNPGYSFMNQLQLLAITHEIFSSFDDNYKVNGIFVNISKAFHKVWHDGIIHKIKHNGISGNLLNLLTFIS